MGYAIYETPMGDAGYAVSDTCHEEGCTEEVDRGVAYLCGDQPRRVRRVQTRWRRRKQQRPVALVRREA